MKKLNIAFIWHFHQPNYQKDPENDFLLPWVRLHATKDYLDMLLRIKKFKNLKLNFNFTPVLLSSLQKYIKGIKDIHLNLFLKDKNELTDNDKIFILNNYFDLNYKNMVLKRPYFVTLYEKRAHELNQSVDMFTPQEYCDIMTNYTLCWIDELFIDNYPELNELFKKQKDYTLSDRKKIYDIQLDIMKRILVEYRNYQNENRIEILTSPYYHPIIPLLIDFKNKEIKNFENLEQNFSHIVDAKAQIKLAKEKYFEIFNKEPKGMWLSEQCICPKTAELLALEGFSYTIADEGILAKTIKKDFVRDFEGNLQNPYELNISYKTKAKHSINLLFCDSFFSNLINFTYGNYDSKASAIDMYEKIKTIQEKLENSPNENHILTIALDGENCWETYADDGNQFLDTLYSLIETDESLNTTLVSDYIENNKPKQIDNLKAGSWINSNFDLWIGEPSKNAAWLYFSSVYNDWKNYKENNSNNNSDNAEQIEKAYKELLIAQGSDWFWWYGEPNESRSDGVFDFLFRNHLMNVYRLLKLDIPSYLSMPLVNSISSPLKKPVSSISPSLSCDIKDEQNEWQNAGHIFIPDSPISNADKLIKNICFGYDEENIYFRFELNQNSIKINFEEFKNQISIYFINKNAKYYSTVRQVNKNKIVSPILKNHFSDEFYFTFAKNSDRNNISKPRLNKAINYNLWESEMCKNSKINYKDIIELKISFKDLGFLNHDFSFLIVNSINDLISQTYPIDILVEAN